MKKLFKVYAMNTKPAIRVIEITKDDFKEELDNLFSLNFDIYDSDHSIELEYDDIEYSMYLKAMEILDKKGFIECGDYCICKADHKEDVRIPFICDIEKLI